MNATAPCPASTWVLLRGLTREQGHWGDFPNMLQAALPQDSQVLTPDLPGNGQWWQQRSPTSVADMVQALRQQLKESGRPAPYRVVALSLGAMVTVEWAHRHPGELQDAVLISTSLKPYSPPWRRMQPQRYPALLRLLLTQAPHEAWERAILQMTTQHPLGQAANETEQAHRADAILAHWLRLRAKHPVTAMNAVRQLWAAARYQAPLIPPPLPVLLLNGAADRLVHPSCSAVLAASWGAPLITHPTAGHDLPLDAGPWVVQQLQQWLASRQPTPSSTTRRPALPANLESSAPARP